jgi:hypothetical protein
MTSAVGASEPSEQFATKSHEATDLDWGAGPDSYEPPLVADLGSVRTATLGSSGSGTCDKNNQYYH